MTRRRFLLAPLSSIVGLILACGEVAKAADFYVAPNGNNAWSGRLPEANAAKTDGPLATLDRAQALVAELKLKEPQRARPIVVALRGGTYYQGEISLPRSGAAGAPIVIRGYTGETAVMDGADPSPINWSGPQSGVYQTAYAGDPHLVAQRPQHVVAGEQAEEIRERPEERPHLFGPHGHDPREPAMRSHVREAKAPCAFPRRSSLSRRPHWLCGEIHERPGQCRSGAPP